MRRFLLAVLGLVCLAGCHREPPTMESEAKRYVDELNTATDPKEIGEISQKLYACGTKALEPISEALMSYEYRAKPQLVAIASAIPDTKAMFLVHRQLRNRDEGARRMACYGLTLHPRAPLRDVVFLLSKEAEGDREWATYALAKSDHPQRKAHFIAALNDQNAYVRAQAVRGFRTLPGKDSLALVTPMLSDKDAVVAAEAFLTLAHLDNSNSVVQEKLHTLGENLLSGKAEDRPGSIRLLAATELPQAEPYLSELLGDPDPRIRVVAAEGYGHLGKSAKGERLMHCLNTDPDVEVRVAIAKTIGRLELDGLGNTLLKMAMGKDKRLAAIGVDTLVQLQRLDCLNPLFGIALKSKNPAFRRQAAVGLSNMGFHRNDIKGIDEIMTMTKSTVPKERCEATRLLGDLQGPRFQVRLEEMMNDNDLDVRVAAMEARKKQMGMSLIAPKVMAHPLPSWLEN